MRVYSEHLSGRNKLYYISNVPIVTQFSKGGLDMVFVNEVIEKLADLEHRQWIHWSKEVSQLIEEIINALTNPNLLIGEKERLWNKGMKKLVNWRKYWVPYEKLEEDVRDLDRRWALQAYELMPIKCPVWQCGGILECVEREPPENRKDDRQGYPGDWQTPDLICNNCRSMYRFQGFKKE
jgi:hypothetical protein